MALYPEDLYLSNDSRGQQEGILYAHASIWAVYVQYQHLQAVFWG